MGDALFTDATAMLQVEMGRRLMPHSLYCWKRAVSWQARRVGHTAKPPSLGCTRVLPYPSGYVPIRLRTHQATLNLPRPVALPNALPSRTIVRSLVVTVQYPPPHAAPSQAWLPTGGVGSAGLLDLDDEIPTSKGRIEGCLKTGLTLVTRVTPSLSVFSAQWKLNLARTMGEADAPSARSSTHP